MLLLSEADIKKIFTMNDCVEAMEKAFTLFSEGKSQVPLRPVFEVPKHQGTILFMPSFVEDIDAAAIKIIGIYAKNREKNLPTAPAQVVLMDAKTGMIQAIIDGTYITKIRTGASSSLAFRLFGSENSRIGAIIGAGGQAVTQLEGMLTSRNLDEIRVADIDAERARTFSLEMAEQFSGSYNTKIVAAKDHREAVRDADLVITVTPSTTPVFDANDIKPGATISCVGAYQHHMQEMDPMILPKADKIYFDSKEAVLEESGDILIPLEKGIIKEKDFTGDIGDYLLNKIPGRESENEIIVYENVGIGILDLVTAKAIYEKAVIQNVGLNWG